MSWPIIWDVTITSSPASASYSFDTDAKSTLEILGNNSEPWQAKGGNPSTGGFLALTYPQNFQNCHIVFPELDAGKLVSAFQFECDLRIGNSQGDRAADGFSINFAREGDPVLALKDISPGRGYAGDAKVGGAEDASLPETGTTTGLAICFDTWAGNTLPESADIEGIIVGMDNRTILRKSLATRHGACDHAGKPASRSIWWSWTALQSGQATISTAGSGSDTLLGVYTGTTVATLVPVASNDDDPEGGTTSRVTFRAGAGTAYEIAVDAFGDAAGPIELGISVEIPRPLLRAELSGSDLVVSWPTNATEFVLEMTDSLTTSDRTK